jgi:hypothetical protein
MSAVLLSYNDSKATWQAVRMAAVSGRWDIGGIGNSIQGQSLINPALRHEMAKRRRL